MYSCSEVIKLIAGDEHPKVGLLKRLELRVHLLMCKHCSRYARQLESMAAKVREIMRPVPASQLAQTKDRLLQKLSEKP